MQISMERCGATRKTRPVMLSEGHVADQFPTHTFTCKLEPGHAGPHTGVSEDGLVSSTWDSTVPELKDNGVIAPDA